ncbi:A6 protein [Salmon gill poxvirus]
MEKVKSCYETFVKLTIDAVLGSNSKNEVSDESVNFDMDMVILNRNIDVISINYKDFCQSKKQLFDMMKLVECKELSFVQSCLFGTLKSVYNHIVKTSQETGDLYSDSIMEIVQFLLVKRKLKNVITDMNKETKKIEEDIEICMSVFSIVTKQSSLTAAEITTCTNNIIKIMDKIWTDKFYIMKIVNVMYPSAIETPENQAKLQSITESFYMTPETIQIFLDTIVTWKYPSNIKTKSKVTDIIKTLFKRSSVLRKWKHDKSQEEIGQRIKTISILTTGIINYTNSNLSTFVKMFETFVEVCSEKYNIPRKMKNSDDYKRVALSVIEIAKHIKTEIRESNKNILIETVLSIWKTLEKYLNIGTFVNMNITTEKIQPLIEEAFPLVVNDSDNSVFDDWTRSCSDTGVFDFIVPT